MGGTRGAAQIEPASPWRFAFSRKGLEPGRLGPVQAALAAATWEAVTCFKVAAMASTFSQGRLRSLRPKWP